MNSLVFIIVVLAFITWAFIRVVNPGSSRPAKRDNEAGAGWAPNSGNDSNCDAGGGDCGGGGGGD